MLKIVPVVLRQREPQIELPVVGVDVVLTKIQDSLTLVVRGKAVSLKMLASGDDPVVRKVKFITTVIKAGKRLFILVRPKRVPYLS